MAKRCFFSAQYRSQQAEHTCPHLWMFAAHKWSSSTWPTIFYQMVSERQGQRSRRTLVHSFRQPCLPACLHSSPQRWAVTAHLYITRYSKLIEISKSVNIVRVLPGMTGASQCQQNDGIYLKNITHLIVHSFTISMSASPQKVHLWIHSWEVWQSCEPSWDRLLMQKSWHCEHCVLHNCTPALRSTFWLSKALRRELILSWPDWKRARLRAIHSRTCSTRISTRASRCNDNDETHSESGICWRGWAEAHSFHKDIKADSWAVSYLPAGATLKRARLSSFSTTLSVSKFFQSPCLEARPVCLT